MSCLIQTVDFKKRQRHTGESPESFLCNALEVLSGDRCFSFTSKTKYYDKSQNQNQKTLRGRDYVLWFRTGNQKKTISLV